MGKLEGKVAIVTGAGRGIGKGIALAFAKEGAKLVIAEMNAKTCKEVAEEIRQLGNEALGVVCNVGDAEQVKRMVDEAVTNFGSVDILVNNAQGFVQRVPVEEVEDEHWDKCLQEGVKATWCCCKAVFPHMKGRGGKIINIGSAAGLMGMEGMAVYGATKEAIRAFSRTAAREWGKYKINVNVILPHALTPASIGFQQRYPEQYQKELEENPLRRWGGDPEKDIGRVAVFLASEDSDYMTGQSLFVDGGSTML
jgi:NAD(P)-dependent dehydrogenase (short-subunit alcohol dehydrogenase family)